MPVLQPTPIGLGGLLDAIINDQEKINKKYDKLD